MKKVTFAVLGMGNRGTVYAGMQLRFPEWMEVTAMADTRSERLEAANKYLHLPEDRLFSGAEELLSRPRLADVMVIATQDAQHKEHALKAMELGYDLLLEKPISNKPEEVAIITKEAKRLNRTVIICHVLRYTVFYRQIKKLLDEGKIGKIQSIEAAERVSYYHYAHSYVRGNWHKEADSSPMILAKCSHDMDILAWLAGENCTKITSFGSLQHFRRENMPEGAAERCEQCTLDCPFHAPRFYLSRIPKWPTSILHPEPTEENITQVLRDTDYGRCVYQMDNDVVDHQTVNMMLGDHVTASFQMTGFSNVDSRTIRIVGTEGELMGDFRSRMLRWQRFGEEMQTIDLNALTDNFTGHGGGDAGLMKDVLQYFRRDEFDRTAVTFIDHSAESHYMAFAAEESRKNGGELIDMAEYKKKLGVVSE